MTYCGICICWYIGKHTGKWKGISMDRYGLTTCLLSHSTLGGRFGHVMKPTEGCTCNLRFNFCKHHLAAFAGGSV